jgi:hypothetical protein
MNKKRNFKILVLVILDSNFNQFELTIFIKVYLSRIKKNK